MVITSVAQAYLFVSGLAVSIAATAALTVLVKHLALRWKLVDQPNHRSVHKNPIPRIGGVAIVGGFIVGLAYFYGLRLLVPQWAWMIDFPDKWILVGAGIMFLLGLGDDLLQIKPKVKLFFQALAAFVVVAAGFRFEIPFLYFQDLGALNDVIAAAITFLWIIGIINAVNLMDGMDGLAAGIGVIAIGSLTVALAVNGYGPDIVLVTAFIGALVGFLLYNMHPASIFMGDSGASSWALFWPPSPCPQQACPSVAFPIWCLFWHSAYRFSTRSQRSCAAASRAMAFSQQTKITFITAFSRTRVNANAPPSSFCTR
jgi:UDP-GlcNAc:undecaprenyl-phosphate GlcNAc-1-phosphate transferase